MNDKFINRNIKQPVPAADENKWNLVYQRMQIYMDARLDLDSKLMRIPGGNMEKIKAIYKAIDEALADEANNLVQRQQEQ